MNDNIRMRRYPNERDSLQYWNKQPTNATSILRRGVFFYLPYCYDHNLGYTIGLDFLSKVSINGTMGFLDGERFS